MKFYALIPLLFLSPLLADSSPDYPPNPYDIEGGRRSPAFSEANAASMHFINLIDAQAYDGAWVDSGGLLQDIVPKDQFIAAMRAVRMPLGNANTRSVSSHFTTPELRNGTRGHFMIIKYNTLFRNQVQFEEIVTLMTISQTSYRGRVPGQWRVISYNLVRKR